jgi:hypothetical protein
VTITMHRHPRGSPRVRASLSRLASGCIPAATFLREPLRVRGIDAFLSLEVYCKLCAIRGNVGNRQGHGQLHRAP